MKIPKPLHSRSDCPIGHSDYGPLAPEAFVSWSWPPPRESPNILLDRSPVDLRGHSETGHTNFRSGWR